MATPLLTPSGESAPRGPPSSSLVLPTPSLTLSSNGTSMDRSHASDVPGHCWLSCTHKEISPFSNGSDVAVVPVVSEEQHAVQGITGLHQDPEVSGPRKRTAILGMIRKLFHHEWRVGVHECCAGVDDHVVFRRRPPRVWSVCSRGSGKHTARRKIPWNTLQTRHRRGCSRAYFVPSSRYCQPPPRSRLALTSSPSSNTLALERRGRCSKQRTALPAAAWLSKWSRSPYCVKKKFAM